MKVDRREGMVHFARTARKPADPVWVQFAHPQTAWVGPAQPAILMDTIPVSRPVP